VTTQTIWMSHLYLMHKYILIFAVTHNTLLYNHILLGDSFGPECGALSGHYTRTQKCTQKLCVHKVEDLLLLH
jgi:hypothetical protein